MKLWKQEGLGPRRRCMLIEQLTYDTTMQRDERERCGMEVSRNGGWLRGKDLNLRPLGYEPNELPGCSTPQADANKGWTASQADVPALSTQFRNVLFLPK